MMFDPNKHTYTSTVFAKLVRDAVRFFNSTPVHALPPPDAFDGTRVCAIYYTGTYPACHPYAELNRLAYRVPICMGKVVPKGWRQARLSDDVAGGESVLRYEEGSEGYLTVHEAKLLQTFQSDFYIEGAWGEAMRQIGNAVPVALSKSLGEHLYTVLQQVKPVSIQMPRACAAVG